MNRDEAIRALKPCPFCGGAVRIGVCDDEGNPKHEEYEQNPWSGIGYILIHDDKDTVGECPITCDEHLGIWAYESREKAVAVWNKRAESDESARLRAALAAMTAERDAMRERAEAAQKALEGLMESCYNGDRGMCDMCEKKSECDRAIKETEYAECVPKWRGPVAENKSIPPVRIPSIYEPSIQWVSDGTGPVAEKRND